MSTWILSATGYLELINENTGEVLLREKKKRPLRTVSSGGRSPGRPSNHELAHAEKNQPIRKRRLYEYDWVLASEICDAIFAGEHLCSLDPKHGFPPFRELCRWRRTYPEFGAMIRDAEAGRSVSKMLASIDSGSEAALLKRTGRRRKPDTKSTSQPSPMKEPVQIQDAWIRDPAGIFNWEDVPMVIQKYGSWDEGMRQKKLTQK